MVNEAPQTETNVITVESGLTYKLVIKNVNLNRFEFRRSYWPKFQRG